MNSATTLSIGPSLAKVGAVVVVFALLMGVAVVWSFHWISGQGGTRDEFVKTAGLWAGIITAALTAILGVLSAYFQSQWARELAKTQSSLSIEVENVRGQLNRTLEFAKGRYAAERKAYDELLAVAYSYYYTLAALESQRWNSDQVVKADDAMVSSCRYLAAVDVGDRTTWVSFWQAARAVEEEASKLRGLRQEDPGSEIGKQRHKVWEKHVAVLGKALTDFVEAAARKHRRLDNAITEVGSPTVRRG
jgi:hypothetical protein